MKNYRLAVASPAQATSRTYTFPAPVRGLVLTENLAASGPAGASIIENWFPTATGIRARGGILRHAKISDGAVTSMFVWRNAGVEKFFAADAENIFDVTSVADPNVIPAPEVSGQTTGYYSSAPIENANGDIRLFIVNGSDDALIYDGTDFTVINNASTPAITGVDTSRLSFVWQYAQRLFFIEGGTMNAWYLEVDSFAGTATKLPLASVFKKGGELIMGGTWSSDAGEGLDDRCVFVSSLGEIVVFEGIDPASASTWSRVGVYETSTPLGRNAFVQAGGDFLIAEYDGIVPLSMAVNKDPSVLSLAAVTANIKPAWDKAVSENPALPWEIMKWPSQNMMVVSVPTSSDEPYCFVANLQTLAWTKYTGWDTRCLALWQDGLYFGTSDGRVMQAEVGGNDDGMPYVCTYVGLFDHLQSPGSQKLIHQARTVFLSGASALPKISVSTNYQIKLPAPPNSIPNYVTDTWDVGLWDVAVWDAGEELTVKTKWSSIGRRGFSVAPQVQVTYGITPKPSLELVAIDVLFEVGGVVV